MEYETILFDLSGGIARLTLNRPDRLNSFTGHMHAEVRDALTRTASEGARTLILTGAGRGFCAGQDLSDSAVSPGGGDIDLGHAVETHYNPLIRQITGLNMPVICAVNGVAAGAGANIAFACDIVIAARGAKFIQSFAAIGLLPDSGGTWVLPRLAGQARALGLALTGEPLSAEQAESWGLIWKCVDDDALASTVDALAQRFAMGATLGYAATKHGIRGSMARTLDQELDHERDEMRRLGKTNDYSEGVQAFLEKRKPRFTGS
ncbi:MAG: 2-(1,2-epoxy-1,2-dihydrophenyl)acetyl-CoA isomerase [Alphaproteobacteria bacterium]|nr:2-(1,2-epoxy-1,2-dihydrophenyl)acetyl-CoA isomerase [Alphaproteobacteria bacterium]